MAGSTVEQTTTWQEKLRASVANASAALRYRNYRLWFMGQLASLVGTWMQTTAQGFLIFQLTHSPAYLGYVAFASGIPTWMLMLYGGVVIDRISRRSLLLVTQAAMMILAFILAALTFTGAVQAWHIVLLAFLLGIANAFDAPARQAFAVELVDRPDLTNAIAMNSTMFQLATVVGPAVAGLTYAAFGAAWCFTINGLSFIAVIAALMLMRLQPVPPRPRSTSVLAEMAEGIRYSINHPIIRWLIAIIGMVGLFGMAYYILFPTWAVEVLHGDAATNGWLLSARGLGGALLGALTMVALGRFQWKGRMLTLGVFIFPVALIAFALMTWLPLSLLTLLVVGWGFLIIANLTGALVQTLAPDELRGRVTGVYSLVGFGSLPLGALIAGAMAQWVGAPLTVILGAVILLLFAIGTYVFAPVLRGVE